MEFDVNTLREAVYGLPEVNRKCAYQIVKLCSQISELKDSNKMNSYNLGIVFGPTVMRSRDPYIDFSNCSNVLLIISHSCLMNTSVNKPFIRRFLLGQSTKLNGRTFHPSKRSYNS